METQRIYKAKGNLLLVWTLMLFASTSTKTCKFSDEEDSSVDTASVQQPIPYIAPKVAGDTAKQDSVSYITPVKAKVHHKNAAHRDEDTTITPFYLTPKLHVNPRHDTVAYGDDMREPHTIEDEIREITEAVQHDTLLNPRLAKKTKDTLGFKGKDANIDDKILEQTGSNFFNAEVQGNLNDQMKSAYTIKLLYDSVIASNNKEYIYNTLTITNTTASKLFMQVIIYSPAGWQMVTTNLTNVNLEPFANTIIPMRFSATGNNTASWQKVRIEYRFNNVIDTRKTTFKIKVQAYTGFKANLPNTNAVLTGYQKSIKFPVFVKNSGNTPGSYAIAVASNALKLNTKLTVTLDPGRDTTVFIAFNLSESEYAMLKKEDIRIGVTNEKGETINLIQSLSKVGSVLKDHVSAYLDMPLQLELGAMYQGADNPVQYYGALYGTVDFDADNHLSMSLRSNTIAKGQTNDNSMVRLDYNGKHVQASVGNIQGAGEYMVDGYGARLGYQWKETNKAEVFGMFKSRSGDTKVFGGALQMALKDNLRINDALTVGLDNERQVNSGILSQVTELRISDGKLAFITGVGMEQNNAPLVEGTQRTLVGSSLGYNFQWANKHWAFVSNVLYNSNSYPGVFKGQRLQVHDVRWLYKKIFIGGFYEYNFRKQNYFQDTLLYTDVFNLRTNNYGIKTGWNIKSSSIVAALGNQRQLQEGENIFQTNYNYLNLNIATVLLKQLSLNINSMGGIMSAVGGEAKNNAFVSSSQGSVQFKTLGATFRYDNGPFYYQEYAAYIKKKDNYERIVIGPFAEVHMFKKSLNARFQANYAKTLPTNVTSTNVLMNVNYSNVARGFDFNINGIAPIGGQGNQAYVSLAFRMRIKAPFIAVKKFYNLRLVLFKDANSNGVRDRGEEPVAGQTLSLNGDLFLSDEDGTILYKNTEKGVYKTDFGYSSKLKGWMPSDGILQHIELNGNRTVEIPYKISRVLQGKLLVERDSNSTSDFNPSNIKVVVTGEKNENYSTLTDENGEFYFNLPSGNYIVTLSEAAFGDQFRPVQFSQTADLINNESKTLYFEIKQKRRQINIRKK